MSFVTDTISDEGVLVDVLIGVPPARRKMLLKMGFPVPEAVSVRAVIDTGSYMTGIEPNVLRLLGLDGEIDTVEVHTPSTGDDPHRCPVYAVDFTLFHVGGSLPFHGLRVLATRFRSYEVAKALIGRDVLSRCTLQYFGLDQRFILGL